MPLPSQRRRFEHFGYVVAEPRVFSSLFFMRPPERVNTQIGQVEVVEVKGPMIHHADGWFESYDEILARVDAACEGSATTIVLKVDSSGGELSGCFDTARAIRAHCAAAGKRLISYVEGCATSGGYALAAAGEKIYAEETGLVGSLGVLNVRSDESQAYAAMGVRVAAISSGRRKADGFAPLELREDELEATQARVDSFAASFFDLVTELRPGLSVDSVRALQAGLLHGAAAVSAGLVDEIGSFDSCLASLAGTGVTTMADDDKGEETQNELDAARAQLEKAAEGDGDDAERARKALKALDGKDPEEASAESENADEDDKEGKEGKGESARASGTPATVSSPATNGAAGELGALVVQLSSRVQQLEGASEKNLKAQLLAARPDLPKSVVQLCAGKSYAAAKEIIDAIPVPKSSINSKPAATAGSVGGTRGAGQQNNSGSVASNHSGHGTSLDERMGLSPKGAKVERTAHSLTFDIGDSEARKPRQLAPNAGNGGKAAV
jgi:ClpP class serine protease